jgi:D-alanyl-D-alanine carboxypeptidase/D-alanyl-D-alanine-endopeptidase (penicillin-binding protein 4)
MTRIGFAALLGGLFLSAHELPAASKRDRAPAESRPEAITTLPALQARLSNHLHQPKFAAAAWGVKVVALPSEKTLFEHHAGKLLKPASNAKLYTGALALDRLGPDFRIRTSLYARAKPDADGTLQGDLVVYGRGDPCFAARFNDGSYSNALGPLVEALAAAGVRRVTGDLVGDESFFHGPPYGSAWTWDDLQYYYGAGVSALTVEDNVVDLVFRPGARPGEPCRVSTLPATGYLTFVNRTETIEAKPKAAPVPIAVYRPVGENVVHLSGQLSADQGRHPDAVAVHDPARWFVTLFQEALSRRGITVEGRLRTLNWLDREAGPFRPADWVELGFAESRPVSEIVTQMMKPSQNLYAQLLLLQVGKKSLKPGAVEDFTEELGLGAMKEFLARAGVRPGEALLEEGSGLSRGALVTPDATMALLLHMRRHKAVRHFFESLPIAGVDGSLKSRLNSTPAENNVRAKTGSLRHVNTLSGYVETRAGQTLAFCVMLNNYAGGSGRAQVDAIAEMLAGVEGKL